MERHFTKRCFRCSLFLVGGDPGNNSQYLESNLFDVSSRSTVEEVSKNVIRIKWGVGIVGHVAQTGVSCNVSDCYQDARFNSDIDHITGYTTKTMMCSPIKDQHGAVIGVAQVGFIQMRPIVLRYPPLVIGQLLFPRPSHFLTVSQQSK